MSEKPMARLQRENAILLEIATKAFLLRHLGRCLDTCEKALNEMWDANPSMPRSNTQLIAIDFAYEDRLAELDAAIVKAVEAGIDFGAPPLPPSGDTV